jgi:hypothetical protein
MSIFKNIYANARKNFDHKAAIDDAVEVMRPKHSAEALYEAYLASNAFGFIVGLVGTASGIAYLNYLFLDDAEPLQWFSLVSFFILLLIEIAKKASQFVGTAAFLRGDYLQAKLLLSVFLIFGFLSVFGSLNGTKAFVKQKDMALQMSFLNSSFEKPKFDLDSVEKQFEEQSEAIRNEIGLEKKAKEKAKQEGGHWSPEVKAINKRLDDLYAALEDVEKKKDKALGKAVAANEAAEKSKQLITVDKQQEANKHTWVLTVVCELMSVFTVLFANFYKYLAAKDQVAVQSDLQHEKVQAYYIQTNGTQDLQSQFSELKQAVTLFLNSANSGTNQVLKSGKIGFQQGNSGTNLGTNSVAANEYWKGTGVSNEADFVAKYKDLIEALQAGYIDSRNLCNTYKVNPITVAVAKDILAKGGKTA